MGRLTMQGWNYAFCLISITLMVPHFVCHTLGRLQDDKLMTPIGLSTQSPLERGCGFQHSLCQEAGAVLPGVLPSFV